VFRKFEVSAKPTVAAVNGFALGGGCELAMCCHVRIASEAAKFGQPEVKLGLIPGYGGTQRLPRLVGKGRALQLLLTGEMIDAQEAYRIGLANLVVPAAELMDRARAMVTAMIANAPLALALTGRDGELGLRPRARRGAALRGHGVRPRRGDRRHGRGDEGVPREARPAVRGPLRRR
jgi:enoyl-CoA hydratase